LNFGRPPAKGSNSKQAVLSQTTKSILKREKSIKISLKIYLDKKNI